MDTKAIFNAVADLGQDERQNYYARHSIPEQVSGEIESLLAFDPHSNTFFANGIDSAAKQISQPPSAPQRFGAFEVRRVLGQGGMGLVWLAERVDGEVEQCAAIKLLHPSLSYFDPSSTDPRSLKMRERFLQERRIMASLSHPNIARLLDAGHTDAGQLYLTLEYIDGTPIDEFGKALDLRAKLALFLKVCAAVSYAHRNLVVHRDLKPSNILVTRDGEPKLLDFGIAKFITPDTGQTKTMERMLTPEYASPEQVTGEETGTSSDVYSLAAILYKLLTGKPPHDFDTPTPSTLTTVICKQEATRPSRWNPSLTGDLDAILLKALRKEPQERYPSVDKLAEDVEAFLEHRPVSARSGDVAYRTRRFLRRHWLAVAAPSIAIVGLASGLVVATKQRHLADDARILAENQTRVAEARRVEAQQQRDIAAQERAASVTQAEIAKREREEADRQRARAESRFEQVRQLALHLADFDRDIRNLDGATKARQALVSTSLSYLDKLRTDADAADPSFQMELADAYAQVADVQAGTGHPNLSQIKESLENLAKAEALLAPLRNSNELAAEKLVDNLDRQARTAGSQRDWELGYRKAAQGIQYLKELRGHFLHPAHPVDLMTSEASLEYTLQGVCVNLEKTPEAVAHGRRSVELRKRIFETTKSTAAETNYASAASAYANTLRYDGAFESALEHAIIARQILERQYQAKHDSSVARRLEMASLFEGKLLGVRDSPSLGRYEEANQAFERTLGIARERAKLDPQDASSRSLFGEAAEELALNRLDSNPQSALDLFDETFRLRSEIPAADPRHSVKAVTLAGSIRALARLHRNAEAAQRLDQLFSLLRQYKLDTEPLEPGNTRTYALRAKAEAAAAAGRIDESLSTWQDLARAFASSQKGPDSDPHWALAHAEVYRALAHLYQARGDSAEAQVWRVKDRALWQLWNRKMPGNAFVQAQLAAAEAGRD